MLAQTSDHHSSRGPFIILSSTGSTNNYAMAKLHAGMLVPETGIIALEQTAGKGQRGKKWLAFPGQNITLTAVFHPPLYEHFVYSAGMALACYDFIKDFGVEELSVKWPNDIYIGDRKAAGMLIENMFQGSSWEWAVVGVGVNLNQQEFSSLNDRAISLSIATGKTYPLVVSAKKLYDKICYRNEWMKTATTSTIMEEYNAKLFKKNLAVRLKKDSAVFTTTIKHVSSEGQLITHDTMERAFNVGEVEFIW